MTPVIRDAFTEDEFRNNLKQSVRVTAALGMEPLEALIVGTMQNVQENKKAEAEPRP